MKKSIIYSLAITLFSLLLSNCQKENFIEEQITESSSLTSEINYIKDSEIPQIISKITSITGSTSLKISPKGKSINYKKAYVDLNRILKVKNKENIKNYTFNIEVEDAPMNEFYNLIVNESPSGKVKNPYVLKYVVDDDALENYINNNGDFKYFKGKKYIMSFNSFFGDKDSNLTKNECDGNGTTINLTGSGGRGGLHDIPEENLFQTEPNGFDYGSGSGYYTIYFNSYNTETQDDTSYEGSISDGLIPLSLPSIGSGTVELVASLSPELQYFWVANVNGTAGTPMVCVTIYIVKQTIDGLLSFEEREICRTAQKSGFITKSDPCIADEGTVGVITAQLNLELAKKLTTDIGLDKSQKMFLVSQLYSSNIEIDNFLDENGRSEEAKKAIHLSIEVERNGLLVGPYNSDFFSKINPYTETNLNDPVLVSKWIAHFTAQCAILKHHNPSWSNRQIFWEASQEMIHLALDIGGLVPVVGIVCDLTNGAIYSIQGDGVNATLSFAAAIPIAGFFSTGSKFATKLITLTNGSKTTLKWIVKANNLIDFGNRGQLRRVLGLARGDLRQAHHIIPWGKNTELIVQQAAKDPRAFHLNEAFNGIPLENALHSGSHTAYDLRIQNRMQDLINNFGPNITSQQSYNGLLDIISDVRRAILKNPNTHINDLIF